MPLGCVHREKVQLSFLRPLTCAGVLFHLPFSNGIKDIYSDQNKGSHNND